MFYSVCEKRCFNPSERIRQQVEDDGCHRCSHWIDSFEGREYEKAKNKKRREKIISEGVTPLRVRIRVSILEGKVFAITTRVRKRIGDWTKGLRLRRPILGKD
uniref:Uncharacterized protein n=1 Tax=viral metagenome TaxID=1070528 RepID=A0A6M3LRT3_9ZZZZ